MTITSRFSDQFSKDITGTLSCFDRVIFKGHLMALCHPKGLAQFVDHTLAIRRKDFMAWAKTQGNRI